MVAITYNITQWYNPEDKIDKNLTDKHNFSS
jgi:hypothetical protein